jgi:hypothetical protein
MVQIKPFMFGENPRDSIKIGAILVVGLLLIMMVETQHPQVLPSVSMLPTISVVGVVGVALATWTSLNGRGFVLTLAVPVFLFTGVVLAGGLIGTYGGEVSFIEIRGEYWWL